MSTNQQNNQQNVKRKPAVPKFFDAEDKSQKKDEKYKQDYEKFIQDISQNNNIIHKDSTINNNSNQEQKQTEHPNLNQLQQSPSDHQKSAADKKQISLKSNIQLDAKLDKISQLFAQKQKNKEIVKKEEVKKDEKQISVIVKKTEKSLFQLEREEYDPARPNDYEEIKLEIERQSRGQKSLSDAPSNNKNNQQNTQMEIENQSPQIKNNSNKNQQEQQQTIQITGEEKALSIMSKFGYKLGQGLGKDGQGITAPIIHMKTGENQAIMTKGSGDLSSILPYDVVMKKIIKDQGLEPSRVIVLLNLVDQSMVDSELEPEVIEECQIYGQVKKCQIYITYDQVVRIFVEYQREIDAMEAYQNLHGRLFGGNIVSVAFYNENTFAQNIFDQQLKISEIYNQQYTDYQ